MHLISLLFSDILLCLLLGNPFIGFDCCSSLLLVGDCRLLNDSRSFSIHFLIIYLLQTLLH